MNNISILNYQGNKASLMPFIKNKLYNYITEGDLICDIFSGSCSVGAFFSTNHTIVSNDAELYSALISSALLNRQAKQSLCELKPNFVKMYNLNYKKNILKYEEYIASERFFLKKNNNQNLEKLYSSFATIWNSLDKSITPSELRKKNNYDLFLRYFSGSYFGIEQAVCIDSIIKTIHFSDKKASPTLYACLFFAMKECSFSKDGHMAQPLNISKNETRHIKQRNKDIFAHFTNKLDEFIDKAPHQEQFGNTIFNLDISSLLKDNFFHKHDIKLIYADPPYTDMQYSRYYHLLNVAAKYEYPNPTIFNGKYTSGLYTEGRNQSDLSKRGTAKVRLKELFEYCNNKEIILALSYAYPKDSQKQNIDRYTISIEDLIDLAKSIFGNAKVQIEYTEYSHANHRNSSTKAVYEYLIICGKESTRQSFDLIALKKDLKNITPSSNNSIYKSHLYWSQKSYNVIDLLIKHLSKEADIVFDPFMGSGVTILEAVKTSNNRNAIGCDVNEMPKFIVENMLERLSKSSLDTIFSDFNEFLQSLSKFYTTTCPLCGSDSNITKVVFDKPSRTEDKFHIKAISYTCPKCKKNIKEADAEDYKLFCTLPDYKNIKNLPLIKNTKIAVGDNNTISNIFTPRNLTILDEIVGYINVASNQEILRYLLMSVIHLSKITDTHSNSQWPLWIPKMNCVEKNIIHLLEKKMTGLKKAQNYVESNYPKTSIVSSFNEIKSNNAYLLTMGSQFISNNEIPDNSVSLIITDPPYMDQVLYSEYMQLYKPFINLSYNLEDEIIVSSSAERTRTKNEYFSLLDSVFEMCSKKLKENHFMCLFFHDSNLDVWSKLIAILEKNGFKYVAQEHIKKSKTVKNILSPKKSLSGDAVLFFENTCSPIPTPSTSYSAEEIKKYVTEEAKKLLLKHGDLSTPELYDLGVMEMLIENGWLHKLSFSYKTLVEIFEESFIWKSENGKWHLQIK